MSSIDSLSFGRATGLGFALAAINPKNLILCAGAGATVGAAGLSGSEDAVVIAVYTAIAASTVAIPVIGYALAKDRMAGPLQNLKVWLQANNATVMAVLLLVLGAVLIGKGLGVV